MVNHVSLPQQIIKSILNYHSQIINRNKGGLIVDLLRHEFKKTVDLINECVASTHRNQHSVCCASPARQAGQPGSRLALCDNPRATLPLARTGSSMGRRYDDGDRPRRAASVRRTPQRCSCASPPHPLRACLSGINLRRRGLAWG
jgi:hypothetical protein